LGTSSDDLKDIPLSYQIMDALRDGGVLVAINAGCLMLSCVPVVGSLVGLVVAFCFDSYIFGRQYLDFPMQLRGMRSVDRRAIADRHRGHTLGLGAAVLLFNLIPLVGAIILTTAVTGAVLLYRQLIGSENMRVATV
jgi:uncharacterized protein involved in cysteine biosynthesis